MQQWPDQTPHVPPLSQAARHIFELQADPNYDPKDRVQVNCHLTDTFANRHTL